MTTRALVRLCVCALVAAAPAAASAQNREHQQLFADLRMIQEQTQQLRAAVASLAETFTALSKKVDDQSGTTRKLFADQGLVISGLTDSARILREKLDATNVSMSKDSHELEAMRQELTAQRTLLTQIVTLLTTPPTPADPAAAATPVDPNAPPVVAAPPPTVPPPPQNPQRAFESALGDYMRADYDMAIRGFEYFLEKFATSPDAARARYHIGESYYLKGSYKEAIAAYEQLITIHKGADLEPMALYKQGLAFEQLGQLVRAKANWELVRKSFPDSSAFMLATQALARVNK
jgi:TolA-binding protein